MVAPCPVVREKREVTWPPHRESAATLAPLAPLACALHSGCHCGTFWGQPSPRSARCQGHSSQHHLWAVGGNREAEFWEQRLLDGGGFVSPTGPSFPPPASFHGSPRHSNTSGLYFKKHLLIVQNSTKRHHTMVILSHKGYSTVMDGRTVSRNRSEGAQESGWGGGEDNGIRRWAPR